MIDKQTDKIKFMIYKKICNYVSKKKNLLKFCAI